jgi:hypothetical protein
MTNDTITPVLGGEDNHPLLAEDAIAEIVNQWATKGFFRLRNMGDKIFYDRIERGVAYSVRLQTHYEHRIVQRVREPFRGGNIDDRGPAPPPWTIAVPRPAPFEERTEVVRVPHTERVQMCPSCAGEGRVSCSACAGQGSTVCLWCHGRGFVSRQVMEPVRDAAGNSTMMSKMVEQPCICSGGRVQCSICHGNRVVTCSTCAGSGSVKTFDQLVVRFQTASNGELLDVTPVPDKWLAEREGEILVDERASHIERMPALPEVAAQKARELLAKAGETDPRDYRIILQHLVVERIPMHVVQYRYAGKERTLWVCGNRTDVYAPKAPWNRNRLLGLVAGGVAAVAGIVWMAVMLWR